jgi:hypothetical protein
MNKLLAIAWLLLIVFCDTHYRSDDYEHIRIDHQLYGCEVVESGADKRAQFLKDCAGRKIGFFENSCESQAWRNYPDKERCQGTRAMYTVWIPFPTQMWSPWYPCDKVTDPEIKKACDER